MEIEPGQVIDGKYRIVRLLGTGGMGAVYEGENVRIRRKVAIKLLHSQVSSQADVVQRFEREAQAAGRIGSEHICEVLDLGVLPDGTRYMVMEYLEGENLSARITRMGRLAPAQSTPLMLQVLDALAAAHAAGIIHRDLKPDNIWVTPLKGGIKDFIKLLDFGVSKFSQIGGEESMNVTRAGSVVGTPYYMSPEQARGMAQVDQRTDIYAIGVVLYQMTAGQVPYQAETFNELLFKIVLEAPPPPQTYAPDLDPEFAAIIAKAMAREPQQRFSSCAEFKDALLGYQARRTGKTPSVPPPMMQGAGGTMMLDQGLGQSGSQYQSPPMAQSGAQRPPSGANWGASTGPLPMTAPGVNQSTANSWGNASGAVAPKPSSKGGAMLAIIAAIVVLGGGALVAVLALGRHGTNAPTAAATTEANATTAPAAPTQAPTIVATADVPAATATPTSEPATTTAAPTAPSSTPSTKPVAKTPVSSNTKHPPSTPTATKPPKSSGNDLGY